MYTEFYNFDNIRIVSLDKNSILMNLHTSIKKSKYI